MSSPSQLLRVSNLAVKPTTGSTDAPSDASSWRRVSKRPSVLPRCMSRTQEAALQLPPFSPKSAKKSDKKRAGSVFPASPRKRLVSVHSQASAGGGGDGNNANGWTGLMSGKNTNCEVERAVQMCSFYPTMRVAGTAFENSLHATHRLNVDTFALPSQGRTRGGELSNNNSFSETDREEGMRQVYLRGSSVFLETSALLRDLMEVSHSVMDNNNESGADGDGGYRRNSILISNAAAAEAIARAGGANGSVGMVQMACAMKRAAMWEVVIVTALAHRAMETEFRQQRLRRVLERHMLPTLLERKQATGSVVVKVAGGRRPAAKGHHISSEDASRNNNASGGSDGGVDSATAVPQGSYLREHDPFFASLNNAALLQSFADTMTRRRFLPGEVIARAGRPSQLSMYFLISGKCEVSKEPVGPQHEQRDTEGGAGAPPDAFLRTTPTDTEGMKSRGATAGACGPLRAPRPIKEVLLPGTSFGGVLASSAVFGGTYRALSQCIVWELRAADFEDIFLPFSDRAMLDKYKEAMRAKNLSWLHQRYSPARVFGSIPIYRKLGSRKDRYLGDFTPMVKVRGEVLFAQHERAGDVYCLLEGTVLRQAREGNGVTRGESGVAQRLGTNSFSAVNAAGRFLLLGDEPHILSDVQPYTCTVSSRVALFFKVPGERFVNALLDDPALYAELRQRLLRQRQANMHLHPDLLAYVPLLQRLPANKREELVQYAQPRVVGRSTSLCEPAQHLSELMLIVSGDVCDPRAYGHKPTKALEVAAPRELPEGVLEGRTIPGVTSPSRQNNKSMSSTPAKTPAGKLERRRHGSDITTVTLPVIMEEGRPPSSATCAAPMHRRRSTRLGSLANHSSLFPNMDTEEDEKRRASAAAAVLRDRNIDFNFSLREVPVASAVGATALSNQPFVSGGTTSCGGPADAAAAIGFYAPNLSSPQTTAQHFQKLIQTAALVQPAEEEELSPSLPPQTSRRFIYALAGSWEALLLEKWPNGWESTSTVALWAIPTHKLRLVYNSCPKPVQAYVLHGLRLARKEDLQLPSVPHTKLPPMTAYLQHQRGEAVVAAVAAALDANAPSAASHSSATSTTGTRRTERKVKRSQHHSATTTASPPFVARADTHSPLSGAGVVAAVPRVQIKAGPHEGGRASPRNRTEKASAVAAAATPSSRNGVVAVAMATVPAERLPNDGRATSLFSKSPMQKSGPAAIADAAASSPRAKATAPSAAVDEAAAACHVKDGPSRSRRRLLERKKWKGSPHGFAAQTAASTTVLPLTVDPAVRAAYDGVFEGADPLLLRIVRDPAVVGGSNAGKTSGFVIQRSAAAAILPPLLPNNTSSAVYPNVAASAAWPAQASMWERWFQAVPSYEPLPGTANAADTLSNPPVFAPNTTVLALAGVPAGDAHNKTLEGHVEYYAYQAPSPTAAFGGAAAAAMPGSGKEGETSRGVSPHRLPKRHAYATR